MMIVVVFVSYEFLFLFFSGIGNSGIIRIMEMLFFLVEEESLSKVAKVEMPPTQMVGGVVPGSLGIVYPPQPGLAAIQPM